MKPVVLVIEDDPQIRRFLRAALSSENFRYHEAADASEGIVEASVRQPDLILLDLGLPDLDGLELIRKIRASSQVPIIVLSARGQESDKITALDIGADDYVPKPFAVGELMARIRAALRRSSSLSTAHPGGTVRFGEIEVDLENRCVRRGGKDVHLTPNEYRLLQVFLKHPGKLLTQRQLLNEVWGPNAVEHAQYLRVYVSQLRRKLERNAARPEHLHTEPGVGYRFELEPTDARSAPLLR